MVSENDSKLSMLKNRKISKSKSEAILKRARRKQQVQAAKIAFQELRSLDSSEYQTGLQSALTSQLADCRTSLRQTTEGIENAKLKADTLRTSAIRAKIHNQNAQRYHRKLESTLEAMKNVKTMYHQVDLREESAVLTPEQIETLSPHARMWKRLEAEYCERLKLESKISQKKNIKERLTNDIGKQKQKRESLDKDFTSWAKDSRYFLGLRRSMQKDSLDGSEHGGLEQGLPKPLWKLYTAARAYTLAFSGNMSVRLAGDLKSLKKQDGVSDGNKSGYSWNGFRLKSEDQAIWPVHLLLTGKFRGRAWSIPFYYNVRLQSIGCTWQSDLDIPLEHLIWDKDAGENASSANSEANGKTTESNDAMDVDSTGKDDTADAPKRDERKPSLQYFNWVQALAGICRPIFADDSDIPATASVTIEQVIRAIEARLADKVAEPASEVASKAGESGSSTPIVVDESSPRNEETV